MKPCVLVTGASGYTGSQVAARFVASGYRVEIMLRNQSSEYLQRVPPTAGRNLLTGRPGETFEIVSRIRPDFICHVAGLSDTRTNPGNIRSLIEANTIMAAELMEACCLANSKGFIFAGSYSQHHGGNHGIEPNSLYAATKASTQLVASYYARLRNLNSIELILFDTYGPNDRRGKILNLFDKATTSKDPVSLTPGQQLISPCHIDDVCGAFSTALDLLISGSEVQGRCRSYYVHGPELMTLRQMAEIYEKVRRKKLNVSWGGIDYPDGQIFKPYVGPALPGWVAQTGFETGLRKIYGEEHSLSPTGIDNQ